MLLHAWLRISAPGRGGAVLGREMAPIPAVRKRRLRSTPMLRVWASLWVAATGSVGMCRRYYWPFRGFGGTLLGFGATQTVSNGQRLGRAQRAMEPPAVSRFLYRMRW